MFFKGKQKKIELRYIWRVKKKFKKHPVGENKCRNGRNLLNDLTRSAKLSLSFSK